MKYFIAIFFGICLNGVFAQTLHPFVEKAEKFMKEKKYDEAKELYEKSFADFPDSKQINKILHDYAFCIEMTEGEEAATPLYRELASRQPVDYEVAKAINVLGIFQRYNSNYDSAFYYFNKILPHAERLKFSAVYSNLRWYYVDKGDYVTAMEFALKSLQTDEEKGDSAGIAVSLTNIGEINSFQDKDDEALKKFKTSNEIQQAIRQDVSLSRNYENLGIIYQARDSLDAALFWYKKALENDRKNGNVRGEAFSLMQLGVLESLRNDEKASIGYFTQAASYFNKKASVLDRAVYYKNYGFALQKLKKWKQAIKVYELSVQGFEAEEAKVKLIYCYNNLAYCHNKLGNHKTAYGYLKKHQKTKAAVDNVTIKEQVERLSLQYETEKKERLILEQQNELIAKEARISDYQKAVLLIAVIALLFFLLYRIYTERKQRELKAAFQSTYFNVLQLQNHFSVNGKQPEHQRFDHHTLLAEQIDTKLEALTKNIDQQIQSSKSYNYTVSHELKRYLSQLQTDMEGIERLDNENETVKGSIQKVSHLKILVDKLLEVSQIDNETLHLSEVDVAQLITQCIEEENIPPEITITQEIEAEVVLADRLLLKQAINNLLSNARKNLKTTPNPAIHIVSKATQDGFNEITVTDNGPGIPDDEHRSKIFNTFYQVNSSKEGSGLGLSITKKIMDRHEGYIYAKQNNPQGLIVGLGVPQIVAKTAL